ncbi:MULTISPECIES: hypothetical protein [Acidianus]|uniref:Uncharacterized protein n=1 Tax=Candidatus Acidianus copahuensis TaxID=1160895 RepID=A0A031LS95_9CREN|nr:MULTISPECIES: hypothetical protein [Acidianus]EZQ11257.1 hypothetical protein CM19_01915 [Candidatus Acidianus copahuensis]NON63189.1 hypothetical protein [Acidianus sp. RZ1]
MEDAIRLAKAGKPLTAMNLIKTYVQEKMEGKDLKSMDKVCRDLITAVLSAPSVNDESWGVFVPAPNLREIEAVVEKIKECIG